MSLLDGTQDARSVRVWTLPLSDVPAEVTGLSSEERARQDAYHRAEDRQRFRGGALLVRAIGARALHLAPGAVPVDRTCAVCGGPHGPPALPAGAPRVSISHSGGWIAVAVRFGPVGLDLETAGHSAFTGLAGQILSPTEKAREWYDEHALRRTWVRKESILKLSGVGLRIPMTSVTLARAGAATVVQDHPDLIDGPITVVDFDIDGATAALATTGPAAHHSPLLLAGTALLDRWRLR